MASSYMVMAPKQLEDPLAHLPCSTVVQYKKGQIIYSEHQPATDIYLVLDGKVKVTRLADNGRRTLVDVYKTDEFFGEAAMNLPRRNEQATALTSAKVMVWSSAEIEDVMVKRPRLGVALMQILVRRGIELEHRIDGFSVDNIKRRLARSLIRFAGRMGTLESSGTTAMPHMTHELLAQYVGTSREIVTQYMNELRRQGFVRYSRKGIVLYKEALQEWLRQNRQEAPAKENTFSLPQPA